MTDRLAEPLHPVARELRPPEGGLSSYPPVERWEDWEEYDPVAWPRKVKRRYSLIPTICFKRRSRSRSSRGTRFTRGAAAATAPRGPPR